MRINTCTCIAEEPSPNGGGDITGPVDVYHLNADLAPLPQEHLRVVLLDTKRHLLGVVTVYVGTVNTCLVRAAEVFRPALMHNAPQLIVVHNHPSGDPQPSRQDLELTKHLIGAAELLNVELLAHVVIGRVRWISIRETTTGIFKPHKLMQEVA